MTRVWFLFLHVISSCCYALNLSLAENFWLSSRLSSIQQATRQEARRLLPLSSLKCQDATIIFPGSGGRDGLTDELEARISKYVSHTLTWDWSHHRGTVATAAFDGEAVGEALADIYQDCRSIHIIGVSVGAFCANQMATSLFQSSTRPQIRLTLLDPFCSRGIFGIGYGNNHFGACADYAEQYLNTDDPVPTTNNPLSKCYCIDVTRAPERDVFDLPKGESMHCWPLAYFSRHGYHCDRDTHGSVIVPQHDITTARGNVERR